MSGTVVVLSIDQIDWLIQFILKVHSGCYNCFFHSQCVVQFCKPGMFKSYQVLIDTETTTFRQPWWRDHHFLTCHHLVLCLWCLLITASITILILFALHCQCSPVLLVTLSDDVIRDILFLLTTEDHIGNLSMCAPNLRKLIWSFL